MERGRAVAVSIQTPPVTAGPGSSTQTKTEAIEVALEHSVDDPIVCFLPYSFEDSKLFTEEILAQRGESRIFPRAAG